MLIGMSKLAMGLGILIAGPTLQTEQRVGVDTKGSLLQFSKVEIKWNSDGTEVLQDTVIELTNDYPEWVDVQMIMLNGDRELEQECSGSPCTEIIRKFEPGWNTSDCRFALTPNQPTYWRASDGGQLGCPFTALDMDGPGRPDPETGENTQVLRGTVVFFAVAFNQDQGLWEEIRWNHLTGTANIVDYANAMAWEYKPWAYQAHENRCRITADGMLAGPCPVPGATCTDFYTHTSAAIGVCEKVQNGQALSMPGQLSLGGKYDIPYGRLVLDFFSSGMSLSDGGVVVSADTDLTLHPASMDLRQDNNGPVLTKALAEIWNEFEVKFSETRRCICCWDEVLLSDFTRNDGVPNHFLRSKLGTDKGKARIDGVASNDCVGQDVCSPFEINPVPTVADGVYCVLPMGSDLSCLVFEPGACADGRVCNIGGCCINDGTVIPMNAALLGVSSKILHFDGSVSPGATSGSHLIGTDQEPGLILYDVMRGPGELRQGESAARASGAKGTAGARSSAGK